jgi:hypothetical protein
MENIWFIITFFAQEIKAQGQCQAGRPLVFVDACGPFLLRLGLVALFFIVPLGRVLNA